MLGSYNRSSTLQEKWWGEKTQYVAMLRDAEVDEKPLTDAEGGYCELPYGGVLLTNQFYFFRIKTLSVSKVTSAICLDQMSIICSQYPLVSRLIAVNIKVIQTKSGDL